MKLKQQGFACLALLLLITLLLAPAASAQFLEDAQRLALPGLGVGARALGMGGAYTGVANDFTALYWNPAGLTQSQMGEFSFGLSYLDAKDLSTFFSNQMNGNANVVNLNSLGFVTPLPVRRGAFSLAFGFTRQSSFTSGLSFNGFNPSSSIVQTWAPDGGPMSPEVSLAEQLGLADTLAGRFISPIKGNVQQRGTVTESGGLNNWMIGGAMDVAPNLSVGVTLTYVSGSYRYDRDYHENDVNNIYAKQMLTGLPLDFTDIRVQDFIEDDISGVNAKFGLMYREPGRFRIGFAIKTPTSFSIKETYGTTATSTFRTPDPQGNTTFGPIDNPGSTEYDVHTPWVFSGGLSFQISSLVLSGDADYTDWTTTQFANANQDVLDKNVDFATTFKPTWNLRGGAELELPRLGARLRGGIMYMPSIYKGDPKSFDRKFWTVGAGIPLGQYTMLDFGLAHGWWDTYRVNYSTGTSVPDPRVDEKVTDNTYLLTLTHRF